MRQTVLQLYILPLIQRRMPPWGVPGVSGPPPATYSGQPTGPNGQPVRAMFPSAAGPNGASQATGNEQYKATFPAYSE